MVLNINKIFLQKDVRETPTSTPTKVTVQSVESIPGDATTSATFVDIAGSEVTIGNLNASRTYTLYAIACCAYLGTVTAIAGTKLVIGTTDKQEIDTNLFTTFLFNASCLSGVLTGQTGASSYTAKIKHKISTGTLTTTANIVLIAIEE